MTEDDLVRLYQHGRLDRRSVDRSACVPPEALLAVVEQRASDDERQRSLDHAKTCATCAEELELMRATRVVHERAQAPHARFALIASLLIVAGLGYYRLSRPVSVAVGPSSPADATAIQLVSPDTATARMDSLVWHLVPDASSYGVELRRADGSLVTSGSTGDTTFIVPDSVRIVPGSDIYWTVSATLTDGSRRQSPSRHTHLTSR